MAKHIIGKVANWIDDNPKGRPLKMPLLLNIHDIPASPISMNNLKDRLLWMQPEKKGILSDLIYTWMKTFGAGLNQHTSTRAMAFISSLIDTNMFYAKRKRTSIRMDTLYVYV